MNQFTAFSTKPLLEGAHLFAQTHLDTGISLSSPASFAMHGFHLEPLQYIDIETSLDDATRILEKTHMRTSFVVDSQNQLKGVISKARLASSYVLKTAAKKGLTRAQLTIGDIMVKLAEIDTVSELMLANAKVGDVLKTMEKASYEYLLVTGANQSELRGYFDLIDIAKMTGYSLNQAKSAKTFSQLVDSLVNHNEI
ncbi:CBS domain-containing protein [Pseudoalteromonas piratica]|uniref:CBS domain-containing protein n=1 Tax=Pseudoalteromonas piratica TaxID=1348114 RepID=A0A0A7EN20_9GAMM|nr:CBS domain-containing protein [Pseudoalteromonas piratica]AIY67377.1 hypothetical protein OM33_20300 [Pseudoalteromonas piratica]